MSSDFDPRNKIVILCLQGQFLQAWTEATQDFEKFISAHFLAHSQANPTDRLKWLETALQIALKMNSAAVKSALSPLYSSVADCHEELREPDQARRYRELAASIEETPSDNGPFFHGTKADLKVGDLLQAGQGSNYQTGLKMNHIYFTALVHGAGLAAELAKGENRPRVYIVEPTGPFENDPNVTNKKFPGNLTRSYRSQAPLQIVGEVTDWARQSSEDLQKWREKLAVNKGEIIN